MDASIVITRTHMDKERWLRAVQVYTTNNKMHQDLLESTLLTIDATTIGNETEVFYLIHEILQSRVYDVIQLRLKETLNNPITVPIVCRKATEIHRRYPSKQRRRKKMHEHCSLKRPPGTTNVWFRGINVLSHVPPGYSSHSADWLVFRES